MNATFLLEADGVRYTFPSEKERELSELAVIGRLFGSTGKVENMDLSRFEQVEIFHGPIEIWGFAGERYWTENGVRKYECILGAYAHGEWTIENDIPLYRVWERIA